MTLGVFCFIVIFSFPNCCLHKEPESIQLREVHSTARVSDLCCPLTILDSVSQKRIRFSVQRPERTRIKNSKFFVAFRPDHLNRIYVLCLNFNSSNMKKLSIHRSVLQKVSGLPNCRKQVEE